MTNTVPLHTEDFANSPNNNHPSNEPSKNEHPNSEQKIRDFYAADMGGMMECIAPDAEFKVAGMDSCRGQEAISEMFDSWNRTFPDMQVEVLNVISSGDCVVVEELNRGTHQGPLEGFGETIEATGKHVEFPACSIYKLVDGKIVSWTLYWQSDVVLNQLGVFDSQRRAA